MHKLSKLHCSKYPATSSPNASQQVTQKEASPSPSGGGGGSPSAQRKKEAETLQEAITATALPGDPPLLPGELLSYIGEAHHLTCTCKNCFNCLLNGVEYTQTTPVCVCGN